MLLERLRYARTHFVADFIAGITGAIAGAPQAMGFALVGGVSPVYGLYATILPTIIGGLFSSSRFITVAPTNILMLLVAGALAQTGNPNPPAPLFTLTLMVGLFQILFGLMRFSELTRFVSNAVITGFISGAGVLIILGQLSHIFGVPTHSGGLTIRGVIELIQNIDRTDAATLLVGVVTTVVIYRLHHVPRFKNVATLIAFALVTPVVLIFNWTSVALVRGETPIPAGLPMPALPDLSYVSPLLAAAFATALLASVQHAALVERMRDSSEPRTDLNRDLLAHGLANFAGSLFQAMPGSGSISRTAVNISGGAKSRMANVYAGIIILTIMFLFGGVIGAVPLAALAGHLVAAAIAIIDFSAIGMVWRVNAIGRVSMVATFVAAILLPLEYAIYGGILLSLGLYLWSMSSRIDVLQLVPVGDGHYAEMPVPKTLPDRAAVVLSVHGNLYFAAFRKLESLLPSPEGSVKPVVVLRLRDTESVGTTGINMLLRYDRQLREHGGRLILAGVGKKLHDELQRTGALKRLGLDAIFNAQPVIFLSTEQAAEYAAKLAEEA